MLSRFVTGELVKWKAQPNRKPAILYGVRQCGKSFLVREQFGPSNFKTVHIFDFKALGSTLASVFELDFNIDRIVEELAIISSRDIDLNTDLIVFDEVQECLRAVESLKYFCEKSPTSFLIALGTMLRVTMDQPTAKEQGSLFSFPVGKVQEFFLYPLSFREFVWASKDEITIKGYEKLSRNQAIHEKLVALYKQYLFVGGMPEVVSTWFLSRQTGEKKTDIVARAKEVREQQLGLLTGYQNDFVSKGNIVNGSHLKIVFETVYRSIGKNAAVDSSVGKFRFKGVLPKKSRYTDFKGPIEWLNLAGLVQKIYPVKGKPTSVPVTQIQLNQFKLIPHDIGLLNAFLGIGLKDIIKTEIDSFKGYLAEVFVANELRSEILVRSNYELLSWQDLSGYHEIEFLLKADDFGVYPLEVKSGINHKSASLTQYIKSFNPKYAVKLSLRLGGVQANTPISFPIYYCSQHQKLLSSDSSDSSGTTVQGQVQGHPTEPKLFVSSGSSGTGSSGTPD